MIDVGSWISWRRGQEGTETYAFGTRPTLNMCCVFTVVRLMNSKIKYASVTEGR